MEFADETSCINAINYLTNSLGLGEGGQKLIVDRSSTGPIREGQGMAVGPDGKVWCIKKKKSFWLLLFSPKVIQGSTHVNQRIVKICCKVCE